MPGCMRYPDSGGLSAVGRVRREMVRLQAAGMFEQDVSPVLVARRLRVSAKSVYQWRRRWRAGGEAALASQGPGGAVCRLSPEHLARLQAAFEGGPAAWGWREDQRWTLARVTTLIGRLFHVRLPALPRDRKWFRDGPFTVLGRASLCSLALIAAGSCERPAGSGGAKRPRSGAAGALDAVGRERIMAGGGKGANRGGRRIRGWFRPFSSGTG